MLEPKDVLQRHPLSDVVEDRLDLGRVEVSARVEAAEDSTHILYRKNTTQDLHLHGSVRGDDESWTVDESDRPVPENGLRTREVSLPPPPSIRVSL